MDLEDIDYIKLGYGECSPHQFRAIDLLYGNRCLSCDDRYSKRIPVSVVPFSCDVSNIQPLCKSCAAVEPIKDYRVEAWRVYFLVDTCFDTWEWCDDV